MASINGLPPKALPGSNTDLLAQAPASTQMGGNNIRTAGTKRLETATPAGQKVWTPRAASTQQMPSAYIVPSGKNGGARMKLDDIPTKAQGFLNKQTNWQPLNGGALQIRYAPELSKLGQGPIYQVRGAKSTVNIAAATWVEAAKEGVRISAGGALAPRTQGVITSKPAAETKNAPTKVKPSATRPSPTPTETRIDPYDRKPGDVQRSVNGG